MRFIKEKGKRTMSLLMACVMMLSLLQAASVYAESPDIINVYNEAGLRGAITSATSSSPTTIKLGANITLEILITIENKNIILDLNGKNLTGSSILLMLGDNVNLEVKDTSQNAEGKLHSSGHGQTILNGGASTVNISGGTVSKDGSGTAIDNAGNGNVTVSGGKVISSLYGITNKTGSIIVSGGTVLATGGGHALYSQGNGNVTVSGGTISGANNYAVVSNDGTLNVYGGTISDVSSNRSTVNISGGTLGIVYAHALNLSGDPTLTVKQHFLTNCKFSITDLLTGEVGSITLDGQFLSPIEGGTVVATAVNEAHADVSKFSLINFDGKSLAKSGSDIIISNSSPSSPDTSQYAASVTQNGTTTYYETFADAWDAAGTTATIKLFRDVTSSSNSPKEWPIQMSNYLSYITVDLNGHDIDRGLTAPIYNGVIFYLGSGNLTIQDTSSTDVTQQGRITGGRNTFNSGAITVLAGSTLTMTGGNITGNKSDMNGGAVALSGSSRFTMSGGSIHNNENSGNISPFDTPEGNGGGVMVFPEASFTMTGGSITGNKAQSTIGKTQQAIGGGVAVWGTFNVSGPVNISDNVVTTNGNSIVSNVGLSGPTWININVTGSLNGARMGVNKGNMAARVGVFTTGYNTHNPGVDPTTIFTADYPGVQVQQADNGEAQLFIGTTVPPTPPVPGTYTLAYHPNGGTGTMLPQTTNVGTATTVAANAFTRTDYTFTGWNTAANGTGTAYAAGASLPSQIAGTTVTLYAQWTENTYSVSGTVNDHKANPVDEASVKLMKGNTQIGTSVTTASDGTFTITGVPSGTYNLVVSKNDIIVTILITVSGSDYATGTITLPSGKTNSIVEVKPNTPSIVVGGLDAQFTATTSTEGDKGITAGDKEVIANGGIVEIKFTAEKKAENEAQNANDIKTIASNNGEKVGIFLDLSISKTVTTDTVYKITLIELQNPIDVLIPLDEADQNKNNYVVYRYHESKVDAITTAPNADGEKIELVDNGKTIKLTIKKFSTYAIAYTEPVTPPGPGTPGPREDRDEKELDNNNVIIKNTPGGTIKESPHSTSTEKTFLITPNDGYVIADILIGGKSVGAAKAYIFKNLTKEVEIQAVFVKKTAIPYYSDTTRKEIFIGYSRVADEIMKYIAPQGVTVMFKDNAKYFNDISGHAALKEIDFVAERNLFVGTAPNVFSPEIPFTRAMFVTVVGRLHAASFGEITESTNNPFTDVAQDSWYNKYVTWAHENNIVRGVGGGKFEPNRAMTRQEMAVIMDKYLTFIKADLPAFDLPVFDLPVNEEVVTFIDQANIAEWATASVKAMQQIGMVETVEQKPFNSKANVTRAQAVTWIYRLIHVVTD